MSRLHSLWADVQGLTTDVQVLGYWERRQSSILDRLKTAQSDFEIATQIIHRLAKSLNEKEQYAAVYYLYLSGYLPIENKLPPSPTLVEAKFELGRGLHHNRKYSHSKRLFNELALADFDTDRIEGWWNQSVVAGTTEKLWLKTDFLPALGRFALFIAYLVIAIKTGDFFISTAVFLLFYELYENWWFHYRASAYVKELKNSTKGIRLIRNLRKKLWIELGVSLLLYLLYFLNDAWLIYLVVFLAAFLQVFHYVLRLYYFPKLLLEQNRLTLNQEPGH